LHDFPARHPCPNVEMHDVALGELKSMKSMISGPVILCVDDETIGLAIRKMTLESQGYRVMTADNGAEGLAIFSSEAIDLVILDYKMPGVNGDIVAERMKRLKPGVPILLLSAYVDLPGETLAPVDMYLTKGAGPPVMLKAVAELLTRDADAQSGSS
jgi:CheY-like chemotaxis protein